MTTEELLGRLEADIEEDARKMGRWRQIHRVMATAVTLILIVLPITTAMKLLGEGSIQTYCLFALTVLAAFDGLFKPAAYSARRRVDYSLTDKGEALLPIINEMRRFGHEWLVPEHGHQHADSGALVN